MLLLVSDANVLIDLKAGGIVEFLFQLGREVVVPDALYSLEIERYHPEFIGMGLVPKTIDADGIALAYDFSEKYKRASINDLLCLVLAKGLDCPLITGDLALRGAAAAEGVVLHGTIWVVGEMVNQGLISTQQAKDAYIAMVSAGSRLPWNSHVKNQLEEWGLAWG